MNSIQLQLGHKCRSGTLESEDSLIFFYSLLRLTEWMDVYIQLTCKYSFE